MSPRIRAALRLLRSTPFPHLALIAVCATIGLCVLVLNQYRASWHGKDSGFEIAPAATVTTTAVTAKNP